MVLAGYDVWGSGSFFYDIWRWNQHVMHYEREKQIFYEVCLPSAKVGGGWFAWFGGVGGAVYNTVGEDAYCAEKGRLVASQLGRVLLLRGKWSSAVLLGLQRFCRWWMGI